MSLIAFRQLYQLAQLVQKTWLGLFVPCLMIHHSKYKAQAT